MHSEFPHISEIFLRLCEDVNSPISLGLWLRFKHNQLDLAEYSLPVRDYIELRSFELDYLCASYLSKYEALETGIDLEAAALQKFESSEATCRLTNERLKSFRNGLTKGPVNVFHVAQRKIASLLGPFSVDRLEAGVGWGPGATDDIPRRRAFLDTKIREVPISCTLNALPLMRRIIEDDLHWSSVVLGVAVEHISMPYSLLPHCFSLTDSNVVDTVPKNAKTHRVIAKEPRANAFLQKGYGAFIRKRLKRVGINLDDQTKNQRGAKRAFFDSLATIDLMAASDTMSLELVYELLPIDWAFALDDVRSKFAILPSGRKVKLEKFSSMGNGFTFELETLIFWALASAVMELHSIGGEALVYGDDIIVPEKAANEVIAVLSFAGFSTNAAKSYITGNFFESCGKHYFKGVDVTPIYQKELVNNVEKHIRCSNRLIRVADRLSVSGSLRQEVRRAWAYSYRRAGHPVRFQLPLGTEGDDGWLVPADYFNAVAQDPNFGLKCRVLVRKHKRFPACESSLLSWHLRSGQRCSPEHPVGKPPSGCDVEIEDVSAAALREGRRWVMPTGDFGRSW